MIKHLRHNEIDTDKWDKCIRESFNGLIYAYTWYLDIVHEGWEALVENDYERVMPLTSGKKFGFKYLYQPYFVQQLGVFSRSMLSPEKTVEFIKSIPSAYRLYDFKLNSFNKLENTEIPIVENKNHTLDLIHSYEKLSSNYSSQTKRNLKKSNKHTLTLLKNAKPETIIDLFRDHRGRNLTKWGKEHYNRLKHLMYAAIYKGRGFTYGVFSAENELIAGAFFLKSRNRLIFLFSGLSQQGRETSAMTFLLDAVIEEYSSHQTILDFEGSNDPSLARFYKGFGATEITYPGIFKNQLVFPANLIFNLYRKLKTKQ
jgi:hypothetical protein